MLKENNIERMKNLAGTLTVEELKTNIVQLQDNLEKCVDHVLDVLMEVLEQRIGVEKFIEFCNTL
jgi:hypothetical protein